MHNLNPASLSLSLEDCFEKIELVDRVKDAIARGVPKTVADTASPEASNAKA